VKVTKIIKTGEIESFRVEPWRYSEQRAKFQRDHGVVLPTLKGLERIGDIEELRILTAHVCIRVETDKGRWYQWEFYPGWIWDLASVPRWVRSLIDNDDIFLQEGAIVHDSNYTGHFLGDDLPGLDLTNELIMRMVQYRGKRVRGRVVHIAVDSIYGRSLYWQKTNRAPETLRFVKFSSGII
jgi:hypothetical protein